MSSRKTDTRDARREALAQVQAEQERAERRRRRLVVLVVAAVVLALAVPAAFLIADALRQQDEVADVAAAPIEGEELVDVPSAGHVEGEVPEEQQALVETDEGVLPPVGGDHSPVVQNCGFYDVPVADENAVHSLEHGAVWLAYRPDLDESQVGTLRELAAANPYLLVSPYEGLAAPVVATAWGVQLEVESVEDERVAPFLARYLQGEQTPEPGAPCQGGVGG
ncbi:DUF3105 domain-containing protein [Actinotalea sp. Marseille-Q4924]|uniref:DUF3105 domain-containing protein n=1 Tax=Actinotalea sp. Marseille-Q4924 TaxID=2866571 RepID=UPI001CE499B0|nr:DUF3105 domain-containing protein [Actinotalea sp. Marseille-Q4924]